MTIRHKLESIGVFKSDDYELRIQKNFLVYLAIFMSCGGLIWGGISIVYGVIKPGLIPLGYVVISFYNIVAWSYHKNFNIARAIQVFISLVLPFMFQWSLGGFASSGAIMLWSLLALVASLTFKSASESFTWLVLFVAFTLISAFFDDVAVSYKPEILPSLSVGFLVTNVTIISSIVFGLVLFFVSQQRKDRLQLNETLEKLKVQEEKVRKSSEKQLEDAEKLFLAQKELETRNKALTQSEKELRDITQRQMEANFKLTSAQEELQAQEVKFRAVVENAPLVIFTTDKEGIITLCEGTQLVKIGMRSGQLVGKNIFSFFDANDESLKDNLIKALGGEYQVVLTKLKNEMLECSFTPLRNKKGTLTGMLAMIADVSEREEAQQKLEKSLKRAQTSEAKMREIAEEQLMVSERLYKAEKELQDALSKERSIAENLKSAQSQLVNNEKMASLGQLTAGIAHEINNPINFVYNGIDTLRLTVDEIMEIVNKVSQLQGTDAEKEIKELLKLRDDLNLEELTEDLFALVDDIKKGAVRTIEIVKGLRVFSRLDEEEQKPANINENLDATLILLRNKTKDKIEIKKLYDETMGQINCYPGQLNQVFMNILNNAVQAFPEDHKEPKITIYTENNEHNVSIRIKDNGVGIPDDVKKRIFEPFFTTKPVGVGTGLGLSISYGIIEKHDGEIYVESEPGKGTEFVITLPK